MNRWIPNRVGLVNYWYYDEEEFQFADGKLLLRGGNGSGKSVTMQSLIPLLLDGNKSPERLDPFGSRARQMQDYLLGEERQIDQRTGYLFMELKRVETQNYLTIGIGLQARRYRPVGFWGFAITDGRRIGQDFQLYKQGLGDDAKTVNIPISRRELRDLVGEGGIFCATQGEYMAAVNQLLFGFETLEEYDDLIKLLIHLRSPKLSKEFRPNVLYDIMNSSLQALSDEDLRPLTETIENMDHMRTQLDQLKLNRRAAGRIKSAYDQYNRAVLYNKALSWQKAEQELQDGQNAILQQEQLLQTERAEAENLAQELTALEQEQEALKVKEGELRDGDAFRLEQKYQEQMERQEQLRQEIGFKEQKLLTKVSQERETERQAEEQERQSEELERRVQETGGEMDVQADRARFEGHVFNRADLENAWGRSFDFSPWQRDTGRYREKVALGRLVLEEEQRIRRRYDELLQEQDRLTRDLNRGARRQEACYQALEEGRQNYLVTLAKWYEQNRELLLSVEQRHPLNQLILDYGESRQRGDLEKYLFPIFQTGDQELAAGLLEQRQIIKNLSENEAKLEAELQEWLASPDPEPRRDPQIAATRRLLTKAGVACLPFYEAVDFQSGLSSEVKGRLEAAFEDLGILDALLIPAHQLTKARAILGEGADKMLVSGSQEPQKGPNLCRVLQAVCPQPELAKQARQVLSGLSLRPADQAWAIGDDGSFSFGKVVGRARQGVEARFIGIESRRKYRQEQILALEKELAALKAQRENVQSKMAQLMTARERLKWEFENLPTTVFLDQLVGEWLAAGREVLVVEERLGRQNELVRQQYALLEDQKTKVREQTKNVSLPLQLSAFLEAEHELQLYEVALARLEGYYGQWFAARERSAALLRTLESLRDDVDFLRGELNLAEREREGGHRLILELESLREQAEFKKLRQELEWMIGRLRVIPEQIKEKATRRGYLRGRLSTLSEQLDGARRRQEETRERLQLAVTHLSAEVKLGFALTLSGEDPASWVQQILSTLDKGRVAAVFEETVLTRRLQEAVYEQRIDLLDFGITVGELMQKGTEIASRLEVTARLEGRIVSLYQLSEWLEQEIKNNELLLDEADRELFEEIIMQTVGQKIRAKIYRAEKWVESMNKLMAERDTTSGLTLYLQWKPKPAETEEELGARELTEILKTDVSILREEIFNQVTAHFRSQVQRAKSRLEEQDFRESFHQTIQKVLDYRQWFEFKLFFQKTGEPRRELTNRAFDRLSGGEKAMAMYIPLFSSVYSRYLAARADAPRLISLDEAFAGVDDSNIRDMFQLMEQLGFAYIINSQILWGDYDTVSRLSICELVRPKNADYVTVIRYLWDGACRSLLVDTNWEAAVAQ